MTTRAFRALADADIVDRAAGLFARRGYAKTSVQDIADAVSLSKTGLLHHFPSKDALRSAVVRRSGEVERQAVDAIGDLPAGPARDAHALEIMVDVALAHPGLVALLLSPATRGEPDPDIADVQEIGARALAAFGVDPAAPVTERSVRVIGALSALAVLTLSAKAQDQAIQWRPLILTTCLNTLGHRSPGVPLDPAPSRPNDPEA